MSQPYYDECDFLHVTTVAERSVEDMCKSSRSIALIARQLYVQWCLDCGEMLLKANAEEGG